MKDRINLTFDKIVEYIKDIENKLPVKPHATFAVPLYMGGEVTKEVLDNQAKEMMNFVGLGHYTPNIIIENLPENTGGYITLEQRGPSVDIHVSRNYKKNGNGASAILAHEICHKVLYDNGLYINVKQFDYLNEIYADLATIYVGFGDVINAGYDTVVEGTSFKLGYLEPWNYKEATAIIYTLKNNKPIPHLDKSSINPDDVAALEQWRLKDVSAKRAAYLKSFCMAQKQAVKIVQMTKLIAEKLKETPRAEVEELNKVENNFFRPDSFNGQDEITKPVTAFYYGRNTSNPFLTKRQNAINTSAAILLDALYGQATAGEFKLTSDTFYCPHCGFSTNISWKEEKPMKCPKCKHIVCSMAPRFSVSAWMKRFNERKEEKKNAASSLQARSILKSDLETNLPFWLYWLVKKYMGF